MIDWDDITRFPAFSGPDLCAEYAERLGYELARKKDTLICDSITAVIGIDWTLESIAPRLRREQVVDEPQETWFLDGAPLVEIWPAKLTWSDEGFSHMANAGFQYRLLWGSTPDPVNPICQTPNRLVSDMSDPKP